MSSELVHWELEKKYQKLLWKGEPLPWKFEAMEFRAFNPALGKFNYEYTIEIDMRSHPKGGVLGF